MSEPAPLPPYYRGAATSQLLPWLDRGHEDVQLSAEERDKLACWIDLLVPFCGDYLEAQTWSSSEQAFYAQRAARRKEIEDREKNELAQQTGR
jgi:hypothetical protein